HQGPVEVLPEGRRRAICTAPEASNVARRGHGRRVEGIHHHHGQLRRQAGRLHRHRRGKGDCREVRGRVPRSGLVSEVSDVRGRRHRRSRHHGTAEEAVLRDGSRGQMGRVRVQGDADVRRQGERRR
ncbi:MAG: hypothetical protein ACK559_05265, partial [bacterium]